MTYPMGTMRASLGIREMESSERIAIPEYDFLRPPLLNGLSSGKGVEIWGWQLKAEADCPRPIS